MENAWEETNNHVKKVSIENGHALILKIENLIKKFNQAKGISGLSFSVRSSEIVGLLGPKGAGKTFTSSDFFLE